MSGSCPELPVCDNCPKDIAGCSFSESSSLADTPSLPFDGLSWAQMIDGRLLLPVPDLVVSFDELTGGNFLENNPTA